MTITAHHPAARETEISRFGHRAAGDIVFACDAHVVRRAAQSLLEAMTEAGLDNPRWGSAGPCVSAAAHRLRTAFGVVARGTCASTPPVVREADFAAAARLLLRDTDLVDQGAAQEFVALARDAVLALS